MLRRLFLFAGSALMPFALHAQDIPRQVFKAKTVWVVNQTGKPATENGADAALSKWGHFQLADDSDTADIKIVIFKTGSQETHSQTQDQKTGQMDQSYGASFTLGLTAHAYLKGEKLYFWTGSSDSSGEKGGRTIVENFKKLFPKD